MSSYACASKIVCLHNLWKDKDKFPREHWKSKTYKLKRSIYVSSIRCKSNLKEAIKNLVRNPFRGPSQGKEHMATNQRLATKEGLFFKWFNDFILLADISNLLLNRGSSIFILLEYKVEKLKNKKVGGHAAEDQNPTQTSSW